MSFAGAATKWIEEQSGADEARSIGDFEPEDQCFHTPRVPFTLYEYLQCLSESLSEKRHPYLFPLCISFLDRVHKRRPSLLCASTAMRLFLAAAALAIKSNEDEVPRGLIAREGGVTTRMLGQAVFRLFELLDFKVMVIKRRHAKRLRLWIEDLESRR